jgi:HSP20 family molecular chaperone IbpA
MAITLWRHRRPVGGFTSWFGDSDTCFDTSCFTIPLKRNRVPVLDIQERDGAYLVKVDLPGLKNEAIDLE